LQTLVRSQLWTAMVICVVVANLLEMAWQVDHPDWEEGQMYEVCFLSFFLLEALVRMCAFRWAFFTNHEKEWNIFDLSVVLVSVTGVLLSGIVSTMSWKHFTGSDFALRMIRLCRVMRILVSCRIVKYVKSLENLVLGFVQSFQCVVWMGLMFLSMIFISSIVTTTVVGDHSEEWRDNGEEERLVRFKFGSLVRSMITMFQMVTLDNWADVSFTVGTRMPTMSVFFVGYVLLMGFVMVALLTGVMTQHITEVAASLEKQAQEELFIARVNSFEKAFRRSGQTGLSYKELTELLSQPDVMRVLNSGSSKMTSLSVEVMMEVFKALDQDGDNAVSWEEFRRGLKYVHGPATARQVSLMRSEVCHTLNALQTLHTRRRPPADFELSRRFTVLEARLKKLGACMSGGAASSCRERRPA